MPSPAEADPDADLPDADLPDADFGAPVARHWITIVMATVVTVVTIGLTVGLLTGRSHDDPQRAALAGAAAGSPAAEVPEPSTWGWPAGSVATGSGRPQLLADAAIGLPLTTSDERCCLDLTTTPDPGDAPTMSYLPAGDPLSPPWVTAQSTPSWTCTDAGRRAVNGEQMETFGANTAYEVSNFSEHPRLVSAQVGGRCFNVTTWDLPHDELSSALPSARVLGDGSLDLPALSGRFERTAHPPIDTSPVTVTVYGVGPRDGPRLVISVSPRAPAHRADALAAMKAVLPARAPLRRMHIGGRTAVGRIGPGAGGTVFIIVVEDPEHDRLVSLGGTAPDEATLERWIGGLHTVSYDEWTRATGP